MSPAARPLPHALAAAARPEITVAVDRLVLEDPGMGPARARRIQEAVERRVRGLLEEGGWPDPAGRAGAPDARHGDDDALADALARAVVEAVRRQGGAHGDA
jgi:hypothetical protein